MRIGICGTQSVGKSSLVEALKDKMIFSKYNFYTERSQYLKSTGVPLNKESTFNGQLIFMAERARELLKDNMITDRTSLDVAAFTEASINISIAEKAGVTFALIELAKQYDIIFYIQPTIPLVDNGIRDTDLEFRKIIDGNIKIILGHPYVINKVHTITSKTVKSRADEVVKVVKNKGEKNGNTNK